MTLGAKQTADSRRVRVVFVATLATALLAVTALAAACGVTDEGPTGDPSITGVVASATPAGGSDAVGSFLIDQGSGDYDKASVAVTDETGA